MTRKIKITLISLLSALLLASALFCFMPRTASAKTASSTGKYFTAYEGCRLKYAFKELYNGQIRYPMMFEIDPDNEYTHFLNVYQFAEKHADENDGSMLTDETYTLYEFTLWHVLDDSTNAGEKTAEKIVTMRIVFGLNRNKKPCYAVSTYHHDLKYNLDVFELPKYHEGKNTDASDIVMEEAKKGAFSIIYSSSEASTEGGKKYHYGPELSEYGTLSFINYATSYEQQYKVSFNFRAQAHTYNFGFLGLGSLKEAFTSDTTETGARSVKDWLTISYNLGLLSQEIDSACYEDALKIVLDAKIKDVIINYLVPIEGTPLATKQKMTVREVPVLGTQINVTDVRRRSNFSFDIFETTAYKFDVVNESTYEYNAYYLIDSLVQTETKEGKKLDFFFSLNESYADVFKIADQDNTGFLSREEYEYTLSRVYTLYPEALGSVEEPIIQEKDLYGRFGLISIPDRNMTLQGALANAFGKTEATFNVTLLHQKDGRINKTQYEKLLEDYRYSNYSLFFEEMFNTATGQDDFEATHYLFIAEPGENEIEDGKDKITPGIVEGTGGLLEGVSNFFGNLGSGLGSFFGSKGGTSTIVVVAVVIAGGYLAIKLGLFKGGRNNRRRK